MYGLLQADGCAKHCDIGMSQLYKASNVPFDQKVPKKPRYLKILKSINFVIRKEYKVILRVCGQGMWLHESESNSLIRQA